MAKRSVSGALLSVATFIRPLNYSDNESSLKGDGESPKMAIKSMDKVLFTIKGIQTKDGLKTDGRKSFQFVVTLLVFTLIIQLSACATINNWINPDPPPPPLPADLDIDKPSDTSDTPADLEEENIEEPQTPSAAAPREYQPNSPLVVEAPIGDGIIGVRAEELGENKVKVSVTCDCPFNKGQLRIAFFTASGERIDQEIKLNNNVIYVNKGKDTSEFVATGAGVSSYWLMVRLHRSMASYCRDKLTWRPPELKDSLKPGEYKDKKCVVWRLIEYPKNWTAPSKKSDRK